MPGLISCYKIITWWWIRQFFSHRALPQQFLTEKLGKFKVFQLTEARSGIGLVYKRNHLGIKQCKQMSMKPNLVDSTFKNKVNIHQWLSKKLMILWTKLWIPTMFSTIRSWSARLKTLWLLAPFSEIPSRIKGKIRLGSSWNLTIGQSKRFQSYN